MNRARTLELERANDAWEKVKTIAAQNAKGKYGSYVKGLPAAILANGLGQAAATLLAAAKGQGNNDHQALYNHLQAWLCRDDPSAPYRGKADLMQAITKGDRAVYLRAQAESLAWLGWLKKFAAAYLPEGKED